MSLPTFYVGNRRPVAREVFTRVVGGPNPPLTLSVVELPLQMVTVVGVTVSVGLAVVIPVKSEDILVTPVAVIVCVTAFVAPYFIQGNAPGY